MAELSEKRVPLILQISDLHLQVSPDHSFKEVNVEQRLLNTLQALKGEQAALLLLTGDLTHHAAEAYPRLVNYLKALPFPSFWIPGNHDLAEEMEKYRLSLGRKVICIADWRIILLDSTGLPDGKGGGSLSDDELDFLSAQLADAPESNLLIVLHHHPVKVSSTWQDQIMLGNADQFWQLLGNHPQVRGVIFGHIHHAISSSHENVALYSVPATAAQFKTGTELPELETDPHLNSPAYARYQLHNDGKIDAQVVAVKE